jgi:cyclase
VLAIGDPGGPDRCPDISAGGGTDGMIAGTEAFLKSGNAQTKIVPGRGPLATKADFQAYHDVLVKIRDRIAKLKAAGRTEEPAAPKPLAPDIQARQKQDDAASERVVRAVYQTLA